MINQQLLDFIKSQLLKGLSKETITKELLGSGWNEEDIKEGFGVIDIPIVDQTINPVINPVVSSNINTSNLAQNTNHSGKKVLLIVIALFIIAGGVSGYYFRKDIPVIKDLIKNKDIAPVGEITQENYTADSLKQDNKLEELTKVEDLGSFVDCGAGGFSVSTSNSSVFKDSTAKCLGESVFNDCKNATGVINWDILNDSSYPTMQIINNNGICYFKIISGKTKEYIQCPISIVKGTKEGSSASNMNFINPNLNNPEKYAQQIFNYGTFGLILENGKSDYTSTYNNKVKDFIKDKGCTGTLISTILSNLKDPKIATKKGITKMETPRPIIVPDSYNFPTDQKELDKLLSNYCNQDKNDPMCISIKSFIANNVELCNSIADPELRYYCVLSVNPSKITSQLCDSIQIYADPERKVYGSGVNIYDSCYSELANQTLDIKYCKNRINVMNAKDTIDNYCLTNIALINDSIDICKEIIKNTDRYDCLTKLAVKNNNKSTCDIIDKEIYRLDCERSVK